MKRIVLIELDESQVHPEDAESWPTSHGSPVGSGAYLETTGATADDTLQITARSTASSARIVSWVEGLEQDYTLEQVAWAIQQNVARSNAIQNRANANLA